MIVEPYRTEVGSARRPVPRVALLVDGGDRGRAVSEDGELLDLEDWPSGTRLWAAYSTVFDLVRAGVGEAKCWRDEEIQWRHGRLDEDGWVKRGSDANVIKLPFAGLPVEAQLRGFAGWRDKLSGFGATPTGTSGSAAMSLLKASLERKLTTSSGDHPPIRFTVGGRQELGPGGPGRYQGELVHLDLPAAYARTLAGLRYGGEWFRTDDPFAWGPEYPVFIKAIVAVPELPYGPLVRRPRRAPTSHLESVLLGGWYPVATRLQGAWTREEIQAAIDHGCRLLRVLDAWVHRSAWFPFARWWAMVEEGRAEGGLVGALFKITGNALWGRFCLDPTLGGSRSIRALNGGGNLASRPLRLGRMPWPAHDLAETVSGRIRARLYDLMMKAGDRLISAHTDGMWLLGDPGDLGVGYAGTESPVTEPPGSPNSWRIKERARRLDVLDPQVLRYWPDPPHPAEPFHVVSGVPAEHAAAFFQQRWDKVQ